METPRVIRPLGSSQFVLFCDHASNRVPAELNQLGLASAELARHIAWDIGAAGVTEALSEIFDAPAILCNTSRLVIDCNRQLDAHDLIPEVSDGTAIPGNAHLTGVAKTQRVERFFRPYHSAIESVIMEREKKSVPTIVVSIHSMTASLAGKNRPWQIALSSFLDRSLAEPLLAILRQDAGIAVGDNEPYNLDPTVDYSVPQHAMLRGLQHLQVEFRNDVIADRDAQHQWALRFADALRALRV